MPPEIKKSYNPFKMWGSWVGTIISGILSIIAVTGLGDTIFNIDESIYSGYFVKLDFISRNLCSGGECMSFLLTTPVVFIIYGFLVGWGIHSFFRSFSK